jgi:putative membrane-bound dehydrogenase-like protein
MANATSLSNATVNNQRANGVTRRLLHDRWLTRIGVICCGMVCVLSSESLAIAQDKADEKPEAVIAREAAKLKRVPPSSPKQSLAKHQLREGFAAQLVAHEPQVHDPVAIDFDENGRMFVVQLPPYNAYALPEFKHKGSIQILVDKDNDGVVDQSKTFAKDLNYPTAVACWDGGIFVGDSPDLLYLKDTDGDDVADIRRVVFTGFGADRAGEAHLNSFRWGFDNRIHLSTNLSGGNVKAVDSKAAPISVRGRGFVFDPREVTHPTMKDGKPVPPTFELTSGGGQHGMSMDDWGRKFVCSNSVPAQTLMFDDRYVARNPHLPAPRTAVDIAPGGKFTKLFRISPPEPWRALRTSLRKAGTFRGSDEGGKPFGFFTGATGITVYRGDAWPEEFWGSLLVGDVANNLIYRANLEAKGLSLIARRAEPKAEFLASTDIWFRPVQMANAPDGSIYVLDMSRELIEGAAFLPAEFLKHLDPVGGHERGRIYRIAWNGLRRKASNRRDESNQAADDVYNSTRLSGLETATLAKLINHDNGWHRDTASRLLYQRQDKSAVSVLRNIAQKSKIPAARMTALHSLAGLSSLREADVVTALADADPRVRIQACKLAEKIAAESIPVREQLLKMAATEKQDVLYQVLFSLGEFAHPKRNQAITNVVIKHGTDSWIRLAAQSSLEQGAEEVFERLISNSTYRATAAGKTFLAALAAQMGSANRVAQKTRAMKSLLAAKLDQSEAGGYFRAIFKSNSAEMQNIDKTGQAQAFMQRVIKTARKSASDPEASVENRTESIRTLALAPFMDVKSMANELLGPKQPIEVQVATINLLAGYTSDGVSELLLDRWPTMTPAQRAQTAEVLFSRPTWTSAFLDAITKKEIGARDIDSSRVTILLRHPDKLIRDRVAKLFAVSDEKRAEVVKKYEGALKLDGDLDRGRLLFRKVCSACHRLEGHGKSVGADLKGVATRGAQSVLLNILDPNREVKPKYLVYNLVTEKGRIINGMITTENANSVTIQRPDGTSVTTLRKSIDTLSSTGLSFMPEGLEKEINPQGMADLLKYLQAN